MSKVKHNFIRNLIDSYLLKKIKHNLIRKFLKFLCLREWKSGLSFFGPILSQSSYFKWSGYYYQQKIKKMGLLRQDHLLSQSYSWTNFQTVMNQALLWRQIKLWNWNIHRFQEVYNLVLRIFDVNLNCAESNMH